MTDFRIKLEPPVRDDLVIKPRPQPIIINFVDDRLEINAGGRTSEQVAIILIGALKLLWQQEAMSHERL